MAHKEDRKELKKQGITLLEYIPDYAWFVSVKANKKASNLEGLTLIDQIATQDKVASYFYENICDDNCSLNITLTFFKDVINQEEIVNK